MRVLGWHFGCIKGSARTLDEGPDCNLAITSSLRGAVVSHIVTVSALPLSTFI
jgi:hypothetical protein